MQVLFAEAPEVSQSAYNTYERGQREIPLTVLYLRYSTFNVNPIWMMTGESSRHNQDRTKLQRMLHRLEMVSAARKILRGAGKAVKTDSIPD